jgi:tRNA G18 (ribose-2'-O)-methylase SpoU
MSVSEVIFSGYSPYPEIDNDDRMPHVRDKITARIHKTALGAEKFLKISFEEDIKNKINSLKKSGYEILALEQSSHSIKLKQYSPKNELVLIIGNEVDGVNQTLLDVADSILEIPMLGKKESLNVASATAITLYHLRFS